MGRVIEEATSIPSTEGTRRKTKGASVSACYPWLQAHLRIRKDCLSERDFLLTCQVNLILATTFRDRLVWRLIEVPGEVRHDSSVWVKRTEKVLSRIGEMAAASSPQTGFPIRVYKIHDPAGTRRPAQVFILYTDVGNRTGLWRKSPDLALESRLPVFDDGKGRRGKCTCRWQDKALAVGGDIELEIAARIVLRDARNPKQSLRFAELSLSTNVHRVEDIVEA